jgi:hypothetical protein
MGFILKLFFFMVIISISLKDITPQLDKNYPTDVQGVPLHRNHL